MSLIDDLIYGAADGNIFSIVVCILIILGIGGLIVYKVVYITTWDSETITLKEKWVKYHGNDAKYLISTSKNEVYSIVDSFTRWQWESSNLYACLQPGNTYHIKYYGFRFGLFSDYRNIYNIRECEHAN